MSVSSLKDEFLQEVLGSIKQLGTVLNRQVIVTVSSMGVVKTKEDWDRLIPESYKEEYDYEDGAGSYLWLWTNYTKNKNAKMKISVFKDGKICTLNPETVSAIGTLEGENTIVLLTKEDAVKLGFEIVKDLSISPNEISGTYQVVFTAEDGSDKQIFEVTYTDK